MPIFEYICKECKQEFEAIVQGSAIVACPACKSRRLEKQLSVFAASVKRSAASAREVPSAPCGSCGDPRGPGACSMD